MADESVEVLPPESVSGAALEVMQRAEIDVQISTAHRFPRSMEKFKQRATDMVSLDQDTAASCIYRRPVGKEGGQMKYVEGLSVRTAEIVGACYGNLRVGAIIVEQTSRYVKARGYAHDLESNFACSSEVIEATVDKNGMPYSERMRVVAAKAAVAKARRDATFQVVPRALCKPIEAAARRIAIGDGKTLDQRRDAVVKWINLLGVEPARVYAALGIKGPGDITSEILETLTGIRTAISDKDTSVDEAFPPIVAASTSAESAPAVDDRLTKAKEEAAAKTPANTEQATAQKAPESSSRQAPKGGTKTYGDLEKEWKKLGYEIPDLKRLMVEDRVITEDEFLTDIPVEKIPALITTLPALAKRVKL